MGVNAAGEIFYNTDYKTGNWIKVPGGLKQVSFDGYSMIVMGVNHIGEIYYTNNDIGKNPN